MFNPEKEDGTLLFAICYPTENGSKYVITPLPSIDDEGKMEGKKSYTASKDMPITLSLSEGEFSVQKGNDSITCSTDHVRGIDSLDLGESTLQCAVLYIQYLDQEQYKVIMYYTNTEKVILDKNVTVEVGEKKTLIKQPGQIHTIT